MTKSFGQICQESENKKKALAARIKLQNDVDRQMELIDCEYKTLLLQVKANHSTKLLTVISLRGRLDTLIELFDAIGPAE